MFSSEPVQSKFLFCWLRQGKSRQYKRFPQCWQLFNHQKQVLDLKDRPWDGKPYTINNLPRPLFLPLQGHVMARAIDWGNPACHRTHARSGGTQVLQEYAQHLIPVWNRRQQAEKGELAFAVLSQRSQKHCSHYSPVSAAFTLLEPQGKVFQVLKSDIRHFKWNILIHKTTWNWWVSSTCSS